ncbi:TPA: hypothetical protein DDZ06_01580 [Candidatus Uhrbacteria bacterium]|nr:hypothetical protein [Candidatus Uhrbacteria bacterium]
MFQGGDGINLSIYASDGSFFEDAYLFKKGDLRSILLTKMVKTFSVFKGFSIVFFLGFFVFYKMLKAFEKESESFKVLGRKFFCSLAQEVGLGKCVSGNPVSLCKINDLLS